MVRAAVLGRAALHILPAGQHGHAEVAEHGRAKERAVHEDAGLRLNERNPESQGCADDHPSGRFREPNRRVSLVAHCLEQNVCVTL